MKASIKDQQALSAVSPAALSAYARAAGWAKTGPYGDHSDIYDHEGKPEIILPRVKHLGDYASIVSQLIEIFAKDSDIDQFVLYRKLVTADHDVIKVRVNGADDGTVSVKDGVNLVSSAREMLLAVACSLTQPQQAYYARANKEANDYLSRVRLGQTDHGSFVVTLLTHIDSSEMQTSLFPLGDSDAPIERKMTARLAESLTATAEATVERATGAFFSAVKRGASANLCEALAKLIDPFQKLDVSIHWALTRPMKTARSTIGFVANDAPILMDAARALCAQEPKRNFRSPGFVRTLNRDERQTAGKVTLHGLNVDGKPQSATVELSQSDYDVAIKAHQEQKMVIVKGDLERNGQSWRLLNPSIEEAILHEDDAPE